jgi:hypothetical protein
MKLQELIENPVAPVQPAATAPAAPAGNNLLEGQKKLPGQLIQLEVLLAKLINFRQVVVKIMC